GDIGYLQYQEPAHLAVVVCIGRQSERGQVWTPSTQGLLHTFQEEAGDATPAYVRCHRQTRQNGAGVDHPSPHRAHDPVTVDGDQGQGVLVGQETTDPVQTLGEGQDERVTEILRLIHEGRPLKGEEFPCVLGAGTADVDHGSCRIFGRTDHVRCHTPSLGRNRRKRDRVPTAKGRPRRDGPSPDFRTT